MTASCLDHRSIRCLAARNRLAQGCVSSVDPMSSQTAAPRVRSEAPGRCHGRPRIPDALPSPQCRVTIYLTNLYLASTLSWAARLLERTRCSAKRWNCTQHRRREPVIVLGRAEPCAWPIIHAHGHRNAGRSGRRAPASEASDLRLKSVELSLFRPGRAGTLSLEVGSRVLDTRKLYGDRITYRGVPA